MKDTLHKLTSTRSFLLAIVSIPNFIRNSFDLIISSCIINLLSLVLPLVIFQLYDRILPYKSISSLSWLMVGAAVAILLDSILRQIRTLIGAWWGAKIEHLLSKDAIRRILYSRTDDYKSQEPGVYLDHLNYLSEISSFFSGNVFQVLLDLPFAALFVWATYLIKPEMVWIVIGIITFYIIFIFICNFAFTHSRKSQIEKSEKQFAFYMETFSSMHAIKSIAMEESVLRKAEIIHDDVTLSDNRVQFWNKLPDVVGKILLQVSLFSVILYGAYLLIDGQLTLGILTASTMMVRRAVQPFIMLSSSWMQLSKTKLAIEKLAEISELKQEPNVNESPLPEEIDGAIIFEDVCYQPETQVEELLKNVSFEITPREFVCISGDNQDETSALLKLIYGEFQPTGGDVLIDNFRISRWNMGAPSGVVAYVPHKGELFDGTVMDNITMFEPGKELEAMNVASMLDLDKDIAKLPAGFQTKVSEISNRIFSTSLIQRISLARALMRFPRILLLDRVNQAVDLATETVFQQLLTLLIGKTTIVLVTDDVKYIKHSNRGFIRESGELTEQNLDELRGGNNG